MLVDMSFQECNWCAAGFTLYNKKTKQFVNWNTRNSTVFAVQDFIQLVGTQAPVVFLLSSCSTVNITPQKDNAKITLLHCNNQINTANLCNKKLQIKTIVNAQRKCSTK